MTAFAFILGAVPFAIASGAGAKSRQVLGTAVIGGMTAASLIAIFLVPVSFYVVERLFRTVSRSTRSQCSNQYLQRSRKRICTTK